MQVRAKLMASFRAKLPPGSQGGAAQLQLADGTTVADLLHQLGIPDAHVHLVMINGEAEAQRQRPLADGDELVIFPPVAGG